MRSLIFIIILFTCSCAPEMYVPNMQNIPAFEKKNELIINTSFFSPGGYDFQAAYSVNNKIGVIGNFVSYSNDDAEGAYKAKAKGKFYEIGSGFFTKKRSIIYENYVLLGLGNIENGQGSLNGSQIGPLGNLESGLIRIANQTSATYKRKNFEVSLSNRFSFVRYKNISSEPYIFNQIDMASYLRTKPNFLFIEPSLTFKLGFEKVKFNFQIQNCSLINKPPTTNHYQYFDAMFYCGLNFRL